MNTLLATSTGRISPLPGHEKMPGAFAVEKQLHDMGIDAWTPRKITFKRAGKRRYAEAVVEPYLPGYVFADIPDELFQRAMTAKGAYMATMFISRADRAQVAAFRRRVEAENAEAERIIAAKDHAAMCAYRPGDALQILAGPFADQIVQFARLVVADRPHIEFDAEMFGQIVKGKVDVLDVKAAG